MSQSDDVDASMPADDRSSGKNVNKKRRVARTCTSRIESRPAQLMLELNKTVEENFERCKETVMVL